MRRGLLNGKILYLIVQDRYVHKARVLVEDAAQKETTINAINVAALEDFIGQNIDAIASFDKIKAREMLYILIFKYDELIKNSN